MSTGYPSGMAAVDLMFSNLMLQWCDDLDGALREIRRVLAPGGFFAFSTFGPDTLRELRQAWAAADGGTHVSGFRDMHDIGDAVMRAGLAEPVMDVERRTLVYPDVAAISRDLKGIGARNATAARTRGLTGKGRWRAMAAAYETQRRAGLLPATYEVVYGAAWGARGRAAVPASRRRGADSGARHTPAPGFIAGGGPVRHRHRHRGGQDRGLTAHRALARRRGCSRGGHEAGGRGQQS